MATGLEKEMMDELKEMIISPCPLGQEMKVLPSSFQNKSPNSKFLTYKAGLLVHKIAVRAKPALQMFCLAC
jgi:hypothetical protein